MKIKLESPNTTFVLMEGVLTEAEVDELYDNLEEHAKKVGTINILADIGKLTNIPPKIREKIKIRGRKFSDFKNIGIFGAKPAVRVLAGLILKMLSLGKGETRFFKTEEDARAWLKGAQ